MLKLWREKKDKKKTIWHWWEINFAALTQRMEKENLCSAMECMFVLSMNLRSFHTEVSHLFCVLCRDKQDVICILVEKKMRSFNPMHLVSFPFNFFSATVTSDDFMKANKYKSYTKISENFRFDESIVQLHKWAWGKEKIIQIHLHRHLMDVKRSNLETQVAVKIRH